MRRCKTLGIPVCLFAEPSAREQKHALKISSQGDLSQYIETYFDTSTIGAKNQPGSYVRIANEMKVDVKDIVFLSVSEEELLAAREAGVYAVRRKRPPDWSDPITTESGENYPTCCSMMQLFGNIFGAA
mmetsp:Transcript_34411/g.69520  ORF Transcript_34411/g.69520 Transcript_34411/m.69520 type:complete len:129 (+) Transcript_34411:977-1363(+)